MANVTICSTGEIKLIEAGIGRAGRMQAKAFPLDTGIEGVGMEFSLTRYFPGYGTPRHKHTFDQFRFALAGPREIQDGVLQPDDAGFYPEGVLYGPQLQTEESTGLGLQFMGPNGGPYLTHADLRAAAGKLKAAGAVFEGGVCTQVLPDGRKVNRDGHAACYEAIVGRPPEFPKGRLNASVIMRAGAFRWVPDRHVPGLEHKHYGSFGEYRSGIGLRRLAAGARIPTHLQEDAEILYFLDGSIDYDSRRWHGGRDLDLGTYMFIQNGAQVKEIASETGATCLVISLPMLADITAERNSAARHA